MATLLLLHQPRNRSATWPARATARKGVVPEAACPLSRTIAGSRLSSPGRAWVPGTCSAATPIRRQSVVFPPRSLSPLTVATLTLPSPTAFRLARRRVSLTAVRSTTRSAMAATSPLRRTWLGQIRWLRAATTLARATARRAVVVRLVSLFTPSTGARFCGAFRHDSFLDMHFPSYSF